MRSRNPHLLFATVERIAGRQAPQGVETTSAAAPGPTPDNPWEKRRLRLSHTENTLHLATRKWLATLPRNIDLRQLAAGFPRIANQLARLWDAPGPCLDYLDSLRIDRRVGRRGFPPGIQAELVTAYRYYAKRHRGHDGTGNGVAGQDPWDGEPIRWRS